jgi:predicted GNAT family acetyltransferase
MSEHVVVDNPAASRYELRSGDDVLGVAAYRLSGDVIQLIHTEIDAEHEGEGLGSDLARGVLDDVRHRGLRVRPTCPFVAEWIEKHPAYQDLVGAQSA